MCFSFTSILCRNVLVKTMAPVAMCIHSGSPVCSMLMKQIRITGFPKSRESPVLSYLPITRNMKGRKLYYSHLLSTFYCL